MKAGGVLFADNPAEAGAAAEKILRPDDQRPHAARRARRGARAVAQEYYVGVTWDGFARKPVMIFSDMGGIDIEEVAEKHPDHRSATSRPCSRSPTSSPRSWSRA
jgi:succinyl-CoA synthetase beta subunit